MEIAGGKGIVDAVEGDAVATGEVNDDSVMGKVIGNAHQHWRV